MTKFNALHLVIFVATVLLLSACGQGKQEVSAGDENTTVPHRESSESPATHQAPTYIINKSMGDQVGSISLPNDGVTLAIEGETFESKLSGDKRKYQSVSGAQAFEVKFKTDAFKLRTSNGTLLWKIKLYDDKVKISNNEENENPYQIKIKEAGKRAKIYDADDNEIGKVTYEDGVIEVASANHGYTIKSDKFTLAYGVLILTDIPLQQQMIIIAELLHHF